MSGTRFMPEEISEMGDALNKADQAFDSGDYHDEVKDLAVYDQVQAKKDGYGKIAGQVVTDTGLYGIVADTILANDGVPYLSKRSSRLMDVLADRNYAMIIGPDKDYPETESQIESDHAFGYGKVDLPISDWGGTPAASAGENFMGNYATPEEMSDLKNQLFEQLPPDVVLQSEGKVLEAFYENFPGDFSDLTWKQIENNFWLPDFNLAKNSLHNFLIETDDGVSGLYRKSVHGLHDLFGEANTGAGGASDSPASYTSPMNIIFDATDRYEKLHSYLAGAPVAEHGLHQDLQSGPDAAQPYDPMFTKVDRYLETALKAAPTSSGHGAGASLPANTPATRRESSASSNALNAASAAARGGISSTDARQPLTRGRQIPSGRRDDPIFIHELPSRIAH